MSSDPVQLERRAGQRFDLHLPISIEFDGRSIGGFSQNLSARGVFLYTEANLPEGATLQLIFTMPSEITLAESMRVRCRGRVLRSNPSGCGQGNGVAVQLDAYQYLTEAKSSVDVTRVSSRVSPEDAESEPSRVGAR